MTWRRVSASATVLAASLTVAGCSSSPSTSNADTQTIVTKTALPATVHSPSRPATSAAAVKAAPRPSSPAAPTLTTSDNPAFDLTGSGPDCVMHYFQQDGETVTLFRLAKAGEVITHVSGPDYSINRNDVHWTAGVSRLTYDFPLAQATDMGAVAYFPDGSSESCTISASTSTP